MEEEIAFDTEPAEEVAAVTPTTNRWRALVLMLGVVGGLCALVMLVLYGLIQHLNAPPRDFVAAELTIEPGTSGRLITEQLAQAGIIRSAALLQLFFKTTLDGTAVQAGTYAFLTPTSTLAVGQKLIAGDVVHKMVSLTFVEGERASVFGARAADLLKEFDVEQWNTLTADAEGQLFPDTYFVDPEMRADELYLLLYEQHKTVLTELIENASTTLSRDDVVILASILEREANDEESMRTVAGIFMNRLRIGMPLQADASIEYVIETPLGELPPGQLAQELRELDSPYNTYSNPGLPPTPIGNPGRQTLAAVLDPIESEYLYYLTSDDGTFYYAPSYNEHLMNIERYLR